MERNLTTGNIGKTIAYFALPYLLSYFLQTLYGMADLFIIGQFDGVDGITAVSNGGQVMHMLTVIIVGLAMGTTVTIGKSVGAGKLDAASASIGNTVTFFMGMSVVVMAVLVFLVNPIVTLIGIPAEAVAGTTVSFRLFPGDTVYHCIQCDQCDLPRTWRFPKSDVFHCDCLRCQYCVRLCVYRRSWNGTDRCCTGNNSGTDD